MDLPDIIILSVIAAAVLGIIAFLVVSKRKGKNVGCGCSGNCSSCTSCSHVQKDCAENCQEEKEQEDA